MTGARQKMRANREADEPPTCDVCGLRVSTVRGVPPTCDRCRQVRPDAVVFKTEMAANAAAAMGRES